MGFALSELPMPPSLNRIGDVVFRHGGGTDSAHTSETEYAPLSVVAAMSAA